MTSFIGTNKRQISVYGVISGTIIIFGIIATIELDVAYQWLGYLIMLIAFSAIYVATRQFRDDHQGGVLKFGRGFLFGLSITIVASLVYVAVWEIYLIATDYGFISSYIDSLLESERAAGASEAELAALEEDMERFRQQYDSALFRIPLTFLEIFPVGLLVSIVSAALLKK